MYVRCRHCGKILAEWICPNCIEIRNGRRRAVLEISRAKITCDRCETVNLIFPQARGSAVEQSAEPPEPIRKQVSGGDIL